MVPAKVNAWLYLIYVLKWNCWAIFVSGWGYVVVFGTLENEAKSCLLKQEAAVFINLPGSQLDNPENSSNGLEKVYPNNETGSKMV